MDILITTIAVLLAIVGGYFLYRYLRLRQKVYKPQQTQESVVNPQGEDFNVDSKISTERAYEYLLHVNLNLRINSDGEDEYGVAKIEELIYELRQLLIIMGDSKTVLKWKVCQICADFLPKLVNKYNSAVDTDKKKVTTTVDALRQKVLEIRGVVVANKDEEFEQYADTLNIIMKS